MNNAMIELTSQLLRDHIEELMKGDWEKVRDEVALCHGALYELHGQRIDNENLSSKNYSRIY